MRARVNQAITTAMDMSLHSLGREAVEAERRAWWMTVILKTSDFTSLLTITSGTYGLYVRKLERFGELFWTVL